MYDTLKISYSLGLGESSQPFIDRLENRQYSERETGEVSIYGNYGSLRVVCNETSQTIHISGSVGKFLFGHNAGAVTRGEVERLVERMQDETGLKIGQGKVTRVDIGQTFTMKESPSVYLKSLGDLSRYRRLEQGKSGIRYQTKDKKLLFYDKGLESKGELPEILTGQNLLRYELQIQGRVKQVIGQSVTFRDLSKENIYTGLVNIWAENYQRIIKKRLLKFSEKGLKTMDEKLTPRKVEEIGLLLAIQHYGQDEIINLFESGKDHFTNDKAFQRAIKRIRDIGQKNDLTTESEAIEELDSKILQVLKHFR